LVRIAHILPDSIASDLELEIGSRVVRINGELVRDGIDYRFLEVDGLLELEVAAPGCGESVIYEIEKDPGEGLGIVPAADPVRQCANKCVFCFIDGNPDGSRQSLFLKDDDFRLSFTYGSYVTLTNLGEKGFQRLIDQRLSPLYVSVHATEPAVRERLLGVPRGGEIVEQLRRLTSAGIEVHTQVVLCPEWNDGAHLERTMRELWAVGPGVLSLSVVPVGLTQYNINRPVRLLTPEEAAQAIAQVDAMREFALRERGTGWVYTGDEMYYIAGLPIPEAAYYDDWPLTENGVGSVRQLLDDFDAGLGDVGSFAGRRVAIVTGERMAPVFAPLAQRLAAHTGGTFDVLGVRNTMFGATVTTAGLLPGGDMLNALRTAAASGEINGTLYAAATGNGAAAGNGAYDVVLLPAETLNDDDLFIDSMPLTDLRAAFPTAVIAPAHELTSALAAL
jgi:putative radical SAM enzyme (TIGR03279 family)